MSDEMMIDMSDRAAVSKLIASLRQLRGVHRVTVVKYRPRRSDRQNRYYWPSFVAPFADFIRSQGEQISNEQAHEILKHKFLRRELVDQDSGEAIEFTASTTELSTVEFNEYLDRCAHWLADMFGIVVPEPGVYREREAQP